MTRARPAAGRPPPDSCTLGARERPAESALAAAHPALGLGQRRAIAQLEALLLDKEPLSDTAPPNSELNRSTSSLPTRCEWGAGLSPQEPWLAHKRIRIWGSDQPKTEACIDTP